MNVEARVEPLRGQLPIMHWRWDAETDILSGSLDPGPGGTGLTGTVELTDGEGSIAVLDVAGGVLRGLDVVVWPEVSSVPTLAAPAPAQDGRIVIPARVSQPGIAALELDTTLSVSTDSEERVFHLRIGSRRPVEVVRTADRLLVELDQRRQLAGFW
ncbi:MAG: hypothetical protein ACREMO_00380, partial [Gemmatimonadales bacterium]